jgi:alpha-ketoglutarate-dependent taurine dioxygenase
MSRRLDEHVPYPQGWKAADAGSQSQWIYSLPAELIQAYAAGVGEELDATGKLLNSWRKWFGPVLDTLNDGRGFVLLDRLPVEKLTVEETRRAYWRIGQSLGQPIEQNIEGTLLYEVRDTGRDVGEGVRFSVTNAESSFHTDAAFADQPPEFVGLLSLHTAETGGLSQLVSAYSLHNALAEEAADDLAVLYEPFSFDRRGQFRAGEPEVMVAPMFKWDGNELDTRYLHYYITEGHKSGQPLTADQSAALDKVIEIVSRPDMRVEFSLEPGQMMFTNNHWMLHNRTEFEDHPDPEKRRRYIRLWLERGGNCPPSLGRRWAGR